MEDAVTKYPSQYSKYFEEKILDPLSPELLMNSRNELVMTWTPDSGIKWTTKPGSTIVAAEPTGASGTGIAAPEALQSGYIKEDLKVGEQIVLKGTTGEIIIGTVSDTSAYLLLSDEGVFGINAKEYRFAFVNKQKTLFQETTLSPGSLLIGKPPNKYLLWNESTGELTVNGALVVHGSLAADTIMYTSSQQTRTVGGVAESFNQTYDMVREVINQKIDTASKKILSDFSFDNSNYFLGGVKAGDITWNSQTGAYVSGSGVVLYRKGILGANASNPPGEKITFSLDATTGDLTLRGTIYAKSGSIGGWYIGINDLRAYNDKIILYSGGPSPYLRVYSLSTSNPNDYAELVGITDFGPENPGTPRLDIHRDVQYSDGKPTTKYGKFISFYPKYQTSGYLPKYATIATWDGKEYKEIIDPGATFDDNDIISQWQVNLKADGDSQIVTKAGIRLRGRRNASGDGTGHIEFNASAIFPLYNLYTILGSADRNFNNIYTYAISNGYGVIFLNPGALSGPKLVAPYYDNAIDLGAANYRFKSVYATSVYGSYFRCMDGNIIFSLSYNVADFYAPIRLYVKDEPAPSGAQKGWLYYNNTYNEVWAFFPSGWKALAPKGLAGSRVFYVASTPGGSPTTRVEVLDGVIQSIS